MVNSKPNGRTVFVTKENIRQHIKNILDDNELNDTVTKNFLVPAQDGKAYNTKLIPMRL